MIIKKFQLILIIFVLFIQISSVLAISDSINVTQQVTGVPPVCNNNGICEPALGENSTNCPLDCPAAPPVVVGPAADLTPPVIHDLFISKITLNSANINWKTNEPALCQLFWGRTQEYKGGSISETDFSLQHSTELTNLSPATNYHFKIVCRDPSKNESETKNQQLTTLTPPDITPPANVSNFEAIPGDSQIRLIWQNPPDPDFKAVKIMRSEKFYPTSPEEGTPIYNQKGTSFIDLSLTNGKRYYYTAFAYDKAGNYSSGAIVSATPFKIKPPPPPPPEEITTEEECMEAGYYWYDDACHAEPKIPPPPPEIEKLTLKDFDFWQEDKKIPLTEEFKVKTEKDKPLTISLDYEKVPEVLKTIMVTLEKEDKFFSFLLRINQEKTAYQAVVMSPKEAGIYPLTITILDYKNQTLKKITGQLIVEKPEVRPLLIPWYKNWQNWLYILLTLIILAGIVYLFRKLYILKRRINTNL